MNALAGTDTYEIEADLRRVIDEMAEALRDALPLIERAAVDEARRNKAPTGLPERHNRRLQMERAQKLLRKVT